MSPARPVAGARAFTLIEMLVVLGLVLILTTLVFTVGGSVVRSSESAQMRAAFATMEAAFNEWEGLSGRIASYNGEGVSVPSGVSARSFDIWDPGPPTGGIADTPYNRGRGAGVFAVNLLAQADSVRSILSGIPPQLLRAERAGKPLANAFGVPDMYPAPNLQVPAGAPLYLPSAASVVGAQTASNPSPLSTRSEFVDPWGARVVFVFPGREFRIGADSGRPDWDGTVRTSLENMDIAFGVCSGSRICFVSAGPDGLFGAPNEFAGLAGSDALKARRTAASDNVYHYDLAPPNY